MEGLKYPEDSIIPLYSNLTIEKLKEVLEKVFNSRKSRSIHDQFNYMYERMSPLIREEFNKAVLNYTMDKHQIEAIEASETNKTVENFTKKEPIEGTGKIRKKNTHLTLKKKKRKK